MKKFHSVSFRIIFASIFGFLLFFLVVVLVARIQVKQGVTDYIENHLVVYEGTINNEVLDVRKSLEKTVAWLQDTLNQEFLKEEPDLNLATNCRTAINHFGLETIAIFDANGKQISERTYGTSPSEDLVKSALSGGEIYDLMIINNILYAVGAVPIFADNELHGAIVAKQRVASNSFVREIKQELGIECTIYNGYKVMYSSLNGLPKEIEDKSIIDSVMAGESVIMEELIDEVDYLCDYFPIKNAGGKIVSVFYIGEESSVVGEITTAIIKHVFIISSIVVLIFLGLLILLISKILTTKLKTVGKSIEALSSGNADLTLRIPVKGHDEFADLGNNINAFMDLLQSMIVDLNASQSAISFIGQDLGTNAQESASATNEIMANINNVRGQSKSQMEAVTQTSVVLEKSGAEVENLAVLVGNQVSGIIQSSAAIEQMIGNITSVSESIIKMTDHFSILNSSVQENSSKLGQVGQKITTMSEQSEMLVEANNMISQVAEQTNLLAMNAAIEAAHAGEAGKGFSVVADEIRNLAETSSEQSSNISKELIGITKSIDDVVELSQDSIKSFEVMVSQIQSTDMLLNQIGQAMTEQNLASRQILEALSEIKEKSITVNEKSQDLKAGVIDVQAYMTTVSDLAQTILGSMDEMAAGSQQINTAAVSVSELAQQTRDNIVLMDGLLTQFKV